MDRAAFAHGWLDASSVLGSCQRSTYRLRVCAQIFRADADFITIGRTNEPIFCRYVLGVSAISTTTFLLLAIFELIVARVYLPSCFSAKNSVNMR